MFERILVPTDGGEEAGPVIEKAVDIANRYGATIEAVYVADQRIEEIVPEDAKHAVLNAMRDEGEDATGAIERVAADRGVTINTVVRQGIPHQSILQHAVEHDVDLIVMGTHGRTGLERQIIGSVAERIVRLSPVPVMTVPLERQTEEEPDRSFA